MILRYAIVLVVLLAVVLGLAAFAAWAFLPARHLPGNRARHLRLRLHLRLHPGKGFAPACTLWLRWGRLAALRRSGKIRPSLPLHERLGDPRAHSVFLGRAHYRHRLRVPLEDHVLVMAPPGAYKSALLAWLLRFPGPVVATTTKPDLFALTSAVRSRAAGARVQPAAPRRRAVLVLLVAGRRVPGRGHRDPPRGRVRVHGLPEGRRGRHLLVCQGE